MLDKNRQLQQKADDLSFSLTIQISPVMYRPGFKPTTFLLVCNGFIIELRCGLYVNVVSSPLSWLFELNLTNQRICHRSLQY